MVLPIVAPIRVTLAVAAALAGIALLAASGGAGGSTGGPAGLPAFDQGILDFTLDEPTSLTFGPDGRLYVASLTEIIAVELDPATFDVIDIEQIAEDLEDVIGIAFDPTDDPDGPIALYASRRDRSGVVSLQSVISRFTGASWEREDIITGLPTSRPHLNHLTNGIDFDDEGRLFIAQGSMTEAGITNPSGQTYNPETPLSAAILVADIRAPGFDGTMTYDPPGQPADHNVDLVSGDVAVFAPGLRNPYDLVVHSNGYIYATDNGAVGKEMSLSCTTEGGSASTSDELNLIEEGNYYGFANRNRGRFDPAQCVYRDPEAGSGADFTGPIDILPPHCSCDGIMEYTSDAFGGAMQGDLVYAEFIRGNVTWAQLSADGRSVLDSQSIQTDRFQQPLDVTMGPGGSIFVAEFGGGRVSFMKPQGTPTPTPTPTDTVTLTPTATPTPAATLTPTPTPFGPPGDADCDHTVNSIDAAIVLQFVAGLIDVVECGREADVNADGDVNAIDAALILQIVAGLLG